MALKMQSTSSLFGLREGAILPLSIMHAERLARRHNWNGQRVVYLQIRLGLAEAVRGLYQDP